MSDKKKECRIEHFGFLATGCRLYPAGVVGRDDLFDMDIDMIVSRDSKMFIPNSKAMVILGRDDLNTDAVSSLIESSVGSASDGFSVDICYSRENDSVCIYLVTTQPAGSVEMELTPSGPVHRTFQALIKDDITFG